MIKRFEFSRRLLLASMASLAAPAFAADEPSQSPVARGLLAKNPLALAFETAPDALPDVQVMGPKGEVGLADLIKGKIVLMPIWAEWCLPCLTELPDFARLQQVYGNDKFAIVPVLSGAKKQMTPEITAQFLAFLNASIFEPLIEHKFGMRLIDTLGRQGNSFSLPCNVLIAPDGRVIAREMGLKSNDPEDKTKTKLTEDEAYGRVDKAAHGQTQSLWGTPAGDEFAVCMAGGYFKT